MSETRKVQLNYPLDRLSEPVITRLVTDYDLSPNLIRADVEAGKGGWIVTELTGETMTIDRAVEWIRGQGVGVTEAP
ncbi:NIL domain-containing protein [Capsulimonas corticalis]|uniref:NIL domain-containing protein n=1 Tax=Capsulimonas corticalis TaxID=2219043 RepID=UPI000E657572|nr:NIL domain-containing protein [Capsulimonas corticalis]